MRLKIINFVFSILYMLAVIGVLIGVFGMVHDRRLDAKAIDYITSCTEDGDKPYIVTIVRAQSNTINGKIWFVTLQQDGDNVSYWVNYYKGDWSHETIGTY